MRSIVEIRYRTRARAPVLVGVPFAALAVLPLLATDPPLTPLRVLVALALLLAAVSLVLAGMPRARWAKFDFEGGTLTTPAQRYSLSDFTVLELTGVEDRFESSPVARYRAELVPKSGRRVLLVEDRDPATVLNELDPVIRNWTIPTRLGWGLPERARMWPDPDSDPVDHGVSSRASLEVTASRWPDRRRVLVALLGGTVFVATVMVFAFSPRLGRPQDIVPMSVILSAVALFSMLLVGALISSDSVRVHLSDRLLLERRILGWVMRQDQVPCASVRGAWIVSPAPEAPKHLLIATTEGALSLPCATREFERVADSIMTICPSPTELASPAPASSAHA